MHRVLARGYSSAAASALASASAGMPQRIQSTRPTVDAFLHDLVGDESQPGQTPNTIGVKAVALRDVEAGEIIFQETGPITSTSTMHSIQIGIDQHCGLMGEARFTAHSFEPNCAVSIVELSSHPIDFIALTPIKAGEALSFDYSTTEWSMAAPFVDHATGVEVAGFSHLDDDRKRELLGRGLLPKHIMRLWLDDLHSTSDAGGPAARRPPAAAPQ